VESRPQRVLALASVGATVCLLCVVAGVALLDGRPSHVTETIAWAFVPYAGLTVSHLSLRPRTAVLCAIGIASIPGILLLIPAPPFSDDLYRYLWDGRVLRHGIDPYRSSPEDPALARLRDELWTRINNRELPTIYPPLAQVLFGLADGLAHAPW